MGWLRLTLSKKKNNYVSIMNKKTKEVLTITSGSKEQIAICIKDDEKNYSITRSDAKEKKYEDQALGVF